MLAHTLGADPPKSCCFSELGQRELPVAVVNPTRVRNFARAAGQLAKTDAIDARTIAEFGVKMSPKAKQMVSAARRRLSDSAS